MVNIIVPDKRPNTANHTSLQERAEGDVWAAASEHGEIFHYRYPSSTWITFHYWVTHWAEGRTPEAPLTARKHETAWFLPVDLIFELNKCSKSDWPCKSKTSWMGSKWKHKGFCLVIFKIVRKPVYIFSHPPAACVLVYLTELGNCSLLEMLNEEVEILQCANNY